MKITDFANTVAAQQRMTKPASEPVRILKRRLFASLPPEWPEDLLPDIRQAMAASRQKVVVVDDDPTGTQTVHGIPVLTEWPVDALRSEMASAAPVFFIVTNSRSMPPKDAREINDQIARNLLQAGGEIGREFVVISRSDSTLRGHFPVEVEALENVLDRCDAILLIPFLEEGGRYTIDDVHYVEEGEWLIPVGQTAFARDATFGFRSSNLKEWVEEKFEGQFPAESVDHIPLQEIREGGPNRVAQLLMEVSFENVCVVNAVSRRDLEVVVQALLKAEAAGRQFLYRTAASFVAVRAGLAPRPLLTAGELDLPRSGGGLIVVGSYVAKSSEQLNHLLLQPMLKNVEIHVDALLSDARQADEVARVAEAADQVLRANEDLVLYTSRLLRVDKTADDKLASAQRISRGVASVIRSLSVRPRYLVAKGGITASDIAKEGLGIRRAMVLGQVLPGVPVWKLGAEARYPDLLYVIFPGNVGGPEALADLVSLLRAGPDD